MFRLLLTMVLMLFSSASYAASVAVEKGNVFYKDNEGREKQITFTGLDEYPRLHPNGKWVYFIRSFEGQLKDEKYCPPKGKKIVPGPLKEELWRVKTDGTSAKMLYRAKGSAVDGPDPDYPVYSVSNIQFSPKGDKVYFETPEWVTSAGLHIMNADGSGERLLGAGTETKIILSARTMNESENYSGYIVTTQHRYFYYGGSYDWWYLFTPDLKKELGPLGDDPAYFTDMGEIKYTDGSEKSLATQVSG